MSKRIIILSTFFHPLVGGAEVAAKEIFTRFPNEYEIEVFTSRYVRRFPKYEKKGNLEIRRFGIGATIDRFLFPFLILPKLLTSRYDLVFCVMINEAAIGANLLRLFRKKPVLVTVQEGYTEDWIRNKFGKFYWFYNALYNKGFYYQAISNDLLERTVTRGVKKDRVRLIPNGVDLKNFNARRDEKVLLGLRKRYGLKKEDKIIVTTSRLAQKNAIDIMIRSLQHLSPEYKFLICGTGELEKELKQLSKDMNLQNRVIFCGSVSHNELPDHVRASDVFVRPSRAEGMGNSFIEAMACKVPIIGTDVGGIPDFLKDKETGLFVKMDDPRDLADKIRVITEEKNLRKRVIENGYKLSKNYSWDLISKETQDYVEVILNER